MKTLILIIAFGLLPALTVSADEADDLAPFLDETVFAVARVDLEQLDPGEITPFLQGQVGDDTESGILSELLSTVSQTLEDLGVSRVYAVYSFNDIGEQMPFLIIPTPDADRARRIAAYFYSGDPNGPTSLDVDQRAAVARMFDVAEPIGSFVPSSRSPKAIITSSRGSRDL